MTAVLECAHLVRTFGDLRAVADVSLTIAPGETYGLLGPNGAGKTTTISMICGLLAPTAGTVHVLGREITPAASAAKAAIGLVPQDIALYPDLSARENLRLFGRLQGLRGALEARIDETLDIVGLRDRAKDRIDTYSGGMKRRANIAAGMLHAPTLLVLDEPTVGVDPQSRNSILEAIANLGTAGMAVLYTTHYMEEAERLGDRIGIIDLGRLIAEGTRAELVAGLGSASQVTVRAEGTAPALDAWRAALATLPGVTVSATATGADLTCADSTAQIVDAIAAQSEADGAGVAFVAKPGLDAAAAEAAVDADEADAVVVIPAGFAAAVTAGEPAELRVLGDAGDDVVTGIARSVAERIANRVQTQRVAITTTLAAAALLGEEVPADGVARVTAATPAPITVRDSRFENTFSMMSFFAPGMAMIFLFFVMGAAGRSLITERREGTLARMLAGPTNPSAVLLGKTIGVLALGMTSLLTVWAITALGFGVDWGDPVGVVLVITGAVVAIAGISLVITGLARTESQSEALTIVFALVLSVLGGSFVFTATGFLAEVRKFTPNGQALMAFTDLAAGNASPADVLPAVLLLLGGGLVTGAIGLLAIRRGLAP